MRIAATIARGGGGLSVAVSVWLAAVWLAAMPPAAQAQLFDFPLRRPPADVPGVAPPPTQNIAPPSTNAAPGTPKGPMLQSLPPTASPGPGQPHSTAVPNGLVALMLSARYGRDLPAITNGLHWRVYPNRAEAGGALRPIKEERVATPIFTLSPGGYVVHVGFGLASATKAVQLRGDTVRETFELPAGGLRIEGKVGDARIPNTQISFALYKGSQFEPGDKRPIVQSVQAGDVILVPEGIYHIVSNYGDANSVVRSDIRVQTSKLTDATVIHRAAIITLKLVNDLGGEARANTQWTVLTPGGDIVKEANGAFPRVILAEGDYRAIARNDNRTFERAFKVVTGVDGEVEVLAR
jgi:hypothetical protein